MWLSVLVYCELTTVNQVCCAKIPEKLNAYVFLHVAGVSGWNVNVLYRRLNCRVNISYGTILHNNILAEWLNTKSSDCWLSAQEEMSDEWCSSRISTGTGAA